MPSRDKEMEFPYVGLLLVLGAGWTVSLAHDGIVAESKAEYNLQRMKRTSEKMMVRLSNSRYKREGKVEILFSGTWQSICADNWRLNEADVVCRQLGFGYAVSAVMDGGFKGPASHKQLETHFRCNGNESSILSCHAYLSTCSGKMDAGVICHNSSATNGSLRFISSTQSGYSGILQIFINRVWAYVCDETWDKYDGGVACRQMGFDGIKTVTSHHLISSKYPGWLHNVRCFGGEKTLLQCQHDELIMRSCHSSKYVAALCERYFPTIVDDKPPTPLTTEGIAAIGCSAFTVLVIIALVVVIVIFAVWYRRRSTAVTQLGDPDQQRRRRSNLWSILYPSRRNSHHPHPEVFSAEDAPPPTYNYPWYVKGSMEFTMFTENHGDEERRSREDPPPAYIPLVNMQ